MSYTIDESNLERQELLADAFEDVSVGLLDRLAALPEAECLDVGCGIGRTTELLVDELRRPKRVVGLDADENLLEVARDRGDTETPTEVKFQTGDAADLPFEDDSFDLVYARFLLTHLPDPEPAVAEFRRVCRPGGTIAVQEPDFATVGAWPPSPAYEKAVDLTRPLFDIHMGRKTWGLFRTVGIAEPEVDGEVIVETRGDTVRRLFTRSIEALGGALLQKGVLDEGELEEIVADARRVEEEDGDRFVAAYTVYSVWGEA